MPHHLYTRLKNKSCTINIRRSRARCSLRQKDVQIYQSKITSNYQRIFKNCICDNYWLQINELPIWAYIFAIIFQRKSLHFLCCSFIFITVRQKISENSTKNSLTICLKLYFQRTEINLNALSHDRQFIAGKFCHFSKAPLIIFMPIYFNANAFIYICIMVIKIMIVYFHFMPSKKKKVVNAIPRQANSAGYQCRQQFSPVNDCASSSAILEFFNYSFISA